jgi:hypothetical protein
VHFLQVNCVVFWVRKSFSISSVCSSTQCEYAILVLGTETAKRILEYEYEYGYGGSNNQQQQKNVLVLVSFLFD